MLFSFFLLWKKKSFSRTSKLILMVHKKATYSTKDQKAIKVLGKSTEDVYKWVNDDRIDIYGWIIIFKHSLLVLQLYISIKYITLTWCAEIHIFVMLPFHIYGNKMNIWNDKHQHEAFTKILLGSVWSQIWWRTEEGLTRLSTCRASDNAECWIIQSTKSCYQRS